MKKISKLNPLKLLLVLLTISLTLFQCRKNVDDVDQNPKPAVEVQADVIGIVTDQYSDPIEYVSVTHGNTTVKTDKNGVFIIKAQLLDQSGAQLEFRKAGFFTSYKTFLPIKGKVNNIKVQLVSRTITKVINSSVGGIVTTNGAAQISFAPNTIMDSKGQLYNGNVNVYAYYLDPTNSSTPLEMPGNLTGRNSINKEVLLQTFGMIIVELEDDANQALQILTGKNAEVNLPIPTFLQSQALTTIPTWSFDHIKKVWIEEGIANLVNNSFVFQASHFSFWNCDYPGDLINLSGRLLDNNNQGLGNVEVGLTRIISGDSRSALTTSDGYFSGKVFANSSFSMNVRTAYGCSILSNYQFSTGTIDLNLGNIITNFSQNSIKIKGKILDCNKLPSNNSYFYYSLDNIYYTAVPADINGDFESIIMACGQNSIKYKVVDQSNLKESNYQTASVSNISELLLGSLVACDHETDFFNLTIGSAYHSFEDTYYSADSIGFTFAGSSLRMDSSNVRLYLNNLNIGLVYPKSFVAGIDKMTFYEYYQCNQCSDLSITITQTGPVGTKIKGTIQGSLRDINKVNSTPEMITGNFSIERKY